MTNAAHTPGPWGLDHYVDHVSYFSPARRDDYAFRVESPDDMPEAEAEANAALIAAAPEMLEALKLALDFAETEAQCREHSADETYLNAALTVRDSVRAAIAKTKGGAI